MTWLSRMAGGGWPKLPWGLDAWLLALPYLLFWGAVGPWAILGYLGAVLGIRLGHGRGFDYGKPFKEGSEPEKVEILIPSSLPVYVQKFLIMALTGLCVTLILAVLLLAFGYWLPALIVALSGIAKSLAYFLPKTEWAEYARGVALGLGVYVGLLVI